MRLPNNASRRAFALFGLTAALPLALGGCALIPGGGEEVASVSTQARAANAQTGPMADYPQVLGEPFVVQGVEYVPADTASYDAVGYATFDREAGQGVTVAHKTLPLPSYVEITALDTGRTILARVERRGPMTNARLVALSPAAQMQLGGGEGVPVRLRRVNPPESDRAELRAGRAAKERMNTPKSLLAVLERKLPQSGAASLRSASPPPRSVAAAPRTAQTGYGDAPGSERGANRSYPLRPLSNTLIALAPARPQAVRPAPVRQAPPRYASEADPAQYGDFIVQAAAFSNRANAEHAADRLGGFVTQAGRFYRVRTGPYATRGQAEAALAKVRAAGYSDARVFTAG